MNNKQQSNSGGRKNAGQEQFYVFEAGEFGDVFFGFTATGSMSGAPPYNNLLIFRGTQSSEEAFGDLSWTPAACKLPSNGGKTYGQVSSGVYSFYTGNDLGAVTSLESGVKTAVKALDGSIPNWYVAGHSLGGAVATLAAFDCVVNKYYGDGSILPKLYTYGSMLLGQDDFRAAFTASGPTEVYRVANLADWVPAFTGIEADTPGYGHVGLDCTYLWQTGGDWGNHSLDDNYLAVVQKYPGVIQFGARRYPQ